MKTLRQLIDFYGSDKTINGYTPIYQSKIGRAHV